MYRKYGKKVIILMDEYDTPLQEAFGFTGDEVSSSLEEYGLSALNAEVQKWYDGFVLGLIVDLAEKYQIKSNRESGFGRYDVCLIAKDKNNPAYVLEFKVYDSDVEAGLDDTVQNALNQITEKQYDTELLSAGAEPDKIHHYGSAFQGKRVLIG